jgi:hypothetical protein
MQMPTITVPRIDITSEDVVRALENGLGSSYTVVPGLRLARSSFTSPQPDRPDEIVVSRGTDSVLRAQVSITRQAGGTAIKVQPGGLLWIWQINALGIARKVRQVLQNAPGLSAR